MSAPPINIVFLTQDLCYGGTQRQTMELARRLDKQYYSASIWTLTGVTDLDALAAEYKINVHNLGKGASFTIFSLWALYKELRRERPDILVPCTALPNIWGRILGKVLNVPVIIGTCRGGGATKKQYEYFLWRLAKHMICNSRALYEIISGMGMPSQKITYIPNGVDVEHFEVAKIPLKQRQPLILCIGRLDHDKDYPTLLNAFKIVLKTVPYAKLRIVGNGSQKSSIQEIIAHASFNNAVELIDGSLDIRQHYEQAKIFVLTSVREGQPNVILEAMASGLPIVATNVGGIPSMVQDQHTGFLAQAGCADTIAHNICKLLNNSELCQSMGQAGRKAVIANFSFEQMVNTHQDIFHRLWQEHKGNAA